jgi:ATP-dependent protease ClpP protease subunit
MEEDEIFIIGRIGNLLDEKTGAIIERGVELQDVVAATRRIKPGTKILKVNILTEGGSTKVSDDIYNYLLSLKAQYRLITTPYPDAQTGRGLVASAGVKIYLAGDEREADPELDDIFIHNPRLDPGLSDSSRLSAALDATKQKEDEMTIFYAAQTGNTVEALAPLMKTETALKGSQALDLGFATILKKRLSSPQMILQHLKTHQMNPKQLLEDLLKLIKAEQPVPPPAAAAPPATPAPGATPPAGAAVPPFETASGKMITVAAPSVDKVIGAPATIDGQPAPDGEHPLKSGEVMVIEAGKVKEMKPAVAAVVAPTAELDTRIKAVEDNQSKILEVLTAMQASKGAALSKKDLEDFATILRAEIKTGHRVPEIKSENVVADAAEWNALQKTNGLAALRKTDNPKWQRLYMARYGTKPANP